ncbi:peptidylprolyl isomerase [Ideonella livida]|uniref:Peptidyl-prolyl cis-trans isomerase n=1 Tax=Ideonella livida TaxID=2707176 RepID=A0A7C9THS8_9BURK|nr:peptidylprolyl isomerase [Ideonella livida]NDY90638.1 peptidyl-prolyl cis-trans isomerase [Ideonella livida]
MIRTNPARRLALLAALSLGTALACANAWAQKVRLSTTHGDIVVELQRDKAPRTVDNFLGYVKSGHYEGTVFHRVIDGFMIQGGGFTADLKEKPTRAPIALESRNGLSNVRGAIAMARTMMPDSATAQFFINVVDNPALDSYGGGYAVFGRVVTGMEVVDAIRAVPTASRGPHQNVPQSPVVIKKATIEE